MKKNHSIAKKKNKIKYKTINQFWSRIFSYNKEIIT